MPLDLNALQKAANTAFGGYKPKTANGGNVRSGKFIREFQDYCKHELTLLGLPPSAVSTSKKDVQTFGFKTEESILGAHYLKNIDLTLQSSSSGPLLSISLKSMLSSVGKNVNNRWEEAIGDAANLHARFPMLSLGYLMILPYTSYTRVGSGSKAKYVDEPIIDANGNPSPLAEAIERKLVAARGRGLPTEHPSFYEEVALLVISYPHQPYVMHPTFPSAASGLRADDFFDRLVKRYRDRNASLR